MRANVMSFLRDDEGAVTVDWVVLTAALVGLGIGVVAKIAGGATDYSTGTGAVISKITVATVGG